MTGKTLLQKVALILIIVGPSTITGPFRELCAQEIDIPTIKKSEITVPKGDVVIEMPQKSKECLGEENSGDVHKNVLSPSLARSVARGLWGLVGATGNLLHSYYHGARKENKAVEAKEENGIEEKWPNPGDVIIDFSHLEVDKDHVLSPDEMELLGEREVSSGAMDIETGIHPVVAPDHPGDADFDQSAGTWKKVQDLLVKAGDSRAGKSLQKVGSDLYDAERMPFIINYIYYGSKMFRNYLPYIAQNPSLGISLMGLHVVYDALVFSAKLKLMQALLKKTMGEERAQFLPPLLYAISKVGQIYLDPKGQFTGLMAFLLARIPTSYLPEKLWPLKDFLNWFAYAAGQEVGGLAIDKMMMERLLADSYKDLRKDAGDRACNGLESICDKKLLEVTFPGTHNSFHHRDEGGSSFFLNNQVYGLTGQFNAGIRSFSIDFGDIKDGPSRGVNRLNAVHGVEFIFGPLSDSFKEFKKLLDANPREVIRLIPERINAVTFEQFMDEFKKAGLDQYLPKSAGDWDLTMDEAIKKGVRVFTIFDDPGFLSDGVAFRNSNFYSTQSSSWMNFFRDDFKCELHPHAPHSQYIMDYMVQYLREEGSTGFNAILPEMLKKCVKEWGHVPSAIQVDHVKDLTVVHAADCFNDPAHCRLPELKNLKK